MATNELARLLLRIEADTSRLKRELKVVEGQTRTTGRRMERAFEWGGPLGVRRSQAG